MNQNHIIYEYLEIRKCIYNAVKNYLFDIKFIKSNYIFENYEEFRKG